VSGDDADNPEPMSGKAQSFQELDVYKEACALDLAIFECTKAWPKEEMYSLTDQIRRSSRSVGSNIAEAWAKRRYPAHFTSKLTDADGELQETQHWLMRARAYGYLDQVTFDLLWSQSKQVGRRLGAMLSSGDWSSGSQ
jgi:four helix bundle protein